MGIINQLSDTFSVNVSHQTGSIASNIDQSSIEEKLLSKGISFPETDTDNVENPISGSTINESIHRTSDALKPVNINSPHTRYSGNQQPLDDSIDEPTDRENKTAVNKKRNKTSKPAEENAFVTKESFFTYTGATFGIGGVWGLMKQIWDNSAWVNESYVVLILALAWAIFMLYLDFAHPSKKGTITNYYRITKSGIAFVNACLLSLAVIGANNIKGYSEDKTAVNKHKQTIQEVIKS